jgi:hypothetical protein
MIHHALRARQQEIAVAVDDYYYAVRNRLRRRSATAQSFVDLAAERWRLKTQAPFHVLYVGHPEPWEQHHLPADPGLADVVSTWWLKDAGFSAYRDGALIDREHVGEALFEFVRDLDRRRPVHLVLAYLSGSHVLAAHVHRLKTLGVITAGFHWDDRLYFRGRAVNGQRLGPAALATAYDVNLTCASRSVIKYEAVGGRALFWPEAANPAFFKPVPVPRTHDVAFVGARYGARGEVIERLAAEGFSVLARGRGWAGGPVSNEEIPEILSKGRVVIGFSGLGRSLRASALKARDFEAPMCGAAYLPSQNPDLALAYALGEEIVTWQSRRELVRLVGSLLSDESRLSGIRAAALARALRDHTWTARVRQLAAALGHSWAVSAPPALPMTAAG